MNTPYSFCHYCGAAYSDTERAKLPKGPIVCKSCKAVRWLNPVPAVIAWVEKGGKLLMVRRGIEPFKGHWGLVGGFMEYGETPEQALFREVEEELGVKARIGKLMTVLTDFYDNQQGEIYSSLLLVYETELLSDALKPGDDTSALTWVTRETIKTPIAFTSISKLIKAWAQNKLPVY